MRAKELVVGATLFMSAALAAAIGTSSVTQAQEYYYHGYGRHYGGLYNDYGGYGYSRPDVDRGGPGPRVGGGSGTGIGAER